MWPIGGAPGSVLAPRNSPLLQTGTEEYTFQPEHLNLSDSLAKTEPIHATCGACARPLNPDVLKYQPLASWLFSQAMTLDKRVSFSNYGVGGAQPMLGLGTVLHRYILLRLSFRKGSIPPHLLIS